MAQKRIDSSILTKIKENSLIIHKTKSICEPLNHCYKLESIAIRFKKNENEAIEIWNYSKYKIYSDIVRISLNYHRS